MGRRGDQEGLPGIPQQPKRKIIDEIEDLSLERLAMLAKHKLPVYTYEDANGVLQDVLAETVDRKRKSKLNPKKAKSEEKPE